MALHELENGLEIRPALSLILELDKTAIIPNQLYKDLANLFIKLIAIERHARPVLDTWSLLIVNRCIGFDCIELAVCY